MHDELPVRVVVIGAGLIGTSIALALRRKNVEVALDDVDPSFVRIAVELGAGEELPAEPVGEADVAVLAVPPGQVAEMLVKAQKRGLARYYTDVASVKAEPLAAARALGADVSSFVPGHPLAGSERSGPAAARDDLFLGRPWAVCPAPENDSAAVAAITGLARLCGAEPVVVDAVAHDRAVALISHAPHVVSVAMAARLQDAPEVALGLAGQGVRDVTRIAASDPRLWIGILRANALPVAEVLESVATDLATVAAALRAGTDADGAAAEAAQGLVTDLLGRGGAGRRRLPGKHGGRASSYAQVSVLVPDRPGELAMVFQAAGVAGVNIEDMAIEHSPGRPVGVLELSVRPDAAEKLAAELRARGWSVPRHVGPEAAADSPPGRSLNEVTVAMDGPSGSGKSTASRGVARALGLRYLDTGAMYRAVTLWMLGAGVPVDDADAVAAHAGDMTIESGTDPDTPTIAVDGVDVSGPIRGPEVTGAVSAVASVPEVRRRMVGLQRELIGSGGIVVEGRDIGTVVAPDAETKIYLTASAAARAQRRAGELHGVTAARAQQDMARRDRIDSTRTADPLAKAADAIELDTTELGLQEVIDEVVRLVTQRRAAGER